MNIPSHDRLMEVAKLLPQEAAAVLTAMEHSAQIYLLKTVAVAIDYWEVNGIRLDPVQFEVVVTSIVASSAPTIRTLDAALGELLLLRDRKPTCAHCET